MKRLTALSLIVMALISCQTENEPPPNPAPLPSFTDSMGSRTMPATVAFTNLSNTTSGIATYVWSLGDGANSTQTHVVHTYNQQGIYLVNLVQNTSGRISDTVTKILTINPAVVPTGGGTGGTTPPNRANFTYAAPVYASYTVHFRNTSTNATSYVWHFGDGATSTSSAPSLTHNYKAKGNYTVKLVASGNGGVDSLSRSITVQ